MHEPWFVFSTNTALKKNANHDQLEFSATLWAVLLWVAVFVLGRFLLCPLFESIPLEVDIFLTQGFLCYSQSDCTSVSHRKMHFFTETIQEKGQVRFIQQTVLSEAYIPRNTFKCTLSNQLVFGRAWKVLLDRRCVSYAAVGSRHAVCQDRQANMFLI